jgi:RNA polymerase-associated protein LEO1
MDLGEDEEEGFGEVKVMDLSLGRAPEPRSTNSDVGQFKDVLPYTF